jgi:hypothetical protein
VPHIGDGFIFYGIPKTGSTWVRYAMESMGLDFNRDGDYHAPPSAVPAEDKDGRFSFCFVRRPVDWLRSYWAMRMHDYGPQGRRLDVNERRRETDKALKEGTAMVIHEDWVYPPDYLLSTSFDEFCRNVLSEHPGYVSQLYRLYTPFVNFVGLQERLEKDLVEALTSAGVIAHDLDWTMPSRVNTASPASLAHSGLNWDTVKSVNEAESWINRFYAGGM